MDGVVRNGEDDNDIANDTKEAPADKEPVLRLEEEVLVEGDMLGSHGLVAVLHDQTDAAVDDEADNGQDAEGPLQPEIGDHGVGSQGVGETTESGTARCQGVSE